MRELLKDILSLLDDVCLDNAIECKSQAEQQYSETFRPYRIEEASKDVLRIRKYIYRIKEELERPDKTHIVWIPNTGVMPECKRILIRYEDELMDVVSSISFANILDLSEKFVVKEYAIIEE